MVILSASALTISAVPVMQPTPKRRTRAEVYRLLDEGWFENQQIELTDGETILWPTQSSEHADAVDEVFRILDRHFAQNHWVRMRLPLATSNLLETSPDVSVVPGSKRDYTDHPSTAVLIVEVGTSSLDDNRTKRAGIYAAAGVPEYWVLNLRDRVLEVYRQPGPDSDHPFGHRYFAVEKNDATGHAAPLVDSTLRIAVRDILPPPSATNTAEPQTQT